MEQQYDFERFLGLISNMSRVETIRMAEQEAERVRQLLYPRKGEKRVGKQSEYSALHYSQLLGGFIFYLKVGSKHGIKPTGITEAEFKSFKPVIEQLVEKRELPPAVLEPFYS
jgi:hypothetical protein